MREIPAPASLGAHRGPRLSGAQRKGFFERLGSVLLLVSLATSFLVMAEPAPTDVTYMGAAVCALLTLRLHLPRPAAIYLVLSYAFLLANTISASSCVNTTQCSMYMFITFYLVSIPVLMVHFAMSFGWPYVRRMYLAFFAAIIISSLAGVLARAGVLPGPTDLYFREDQGLRLSPFFKDPNVYAPYLGAGLILYLGHVVAGARKLGRGSLVLALIWFPLFLAFSRAAWLAVAVSALCYLLLSLVFVRIPEASRRLYVLVFSTIAILVPLSIVILIQFDLLWFFEHRLALQSYDSERFSAHETAIGVALDHPLGVGPGRFVGRTHLPGSEFALATHNVYLKLWAENGWLGIAAFLAMVGAIIFALSGLLLRPTGRLPIHIALIACLVGIMVNGWFIDTLHWRHLFVVMGFALVEVCMHRHRPPSGFLPPRPGSPGR